MLSGRSPHARSSRFHGTFIRLPRKPRIARVLVGGIGPLRSHADLAITANVLSRPRRNFATPQATPAASHNEKRGSNSTKAAASHQARPARAEAFALILSPSQ